MPFFLIKLGKDKLVAWSNKHKNLIFLVFCFVLVFLIYGKTLGGDFVFDDRHIASGSNTFLLSNLGQIITSPYWNTASGLYRPITLVSYALNYSLFGNLPWSFHLLNLMFYAWSGYLIFVLIKKLSKSECLARFTALLFLVLPIHTEAVANIVGRAEILALFFSLLFWREIIKEKPKTGLAGFWLFLALGSKEIAAAAIPVGLILFLQKNTGLKHKDWLTILGSGFLYFGARLQVLGWNYFSGLEISIVENPLKFAPFLPRAATAFKILAMYFKKTFWPFNLCSDYSYNQIPVLKNFLNLPAIFGLAIFLFFVIVIVVFWKRAPIISGAAAIFVFGFLIIGNIFFATGTIAGERLMYYPSLGLIIIIGHIIARARENSLSGFLRNLLIVLVLTLAVFYGWRSHRRSLDWLNEKILFASAAQCAPNSVLSRSNLGAMYYQVGNLENAEKELMLAEKIYNGYPKGLNNLGLVYWKKGEKEKARSYFLKALDFKFPYPGAYENLALMALEERNVTEAQKWLTLFYSGDMIAAKTYLGKLMESRSY